MQRLRGGLGAGAALSPVLTVLLHGFDPLLVVGRAGLQRQHVPVEHLLLSGGVQAVPVLALVGGQSARWTALAGVVIEEAAFSAGLRYSLPRGPAPTAPGRLVLGHRENSTNRVIAGSREARETAR